MPQSVLFARVGWMNVYRGPQPDDPKPIGGGKYNRSGVGHEAFNFNKPADGQVYGYFQPAMPSKVKSGRRKASVTVSKIALERIVRGHKSDRLSGVLVIFIAKHPHEGGQRVVGWYKNATVHRFVQKSSPSADRKKFGYFVEGRAREATLVPADRRLFEIPRGRGTPGQANIFYPFYHRGPQKGIWIRRVLSYVNSYHLEDLMKNPDAERDASIQDELEGVIERGTGLETSPEIRAEIERHAMREAKKHFRGQDYTVIDKSKGNPFDLLCSKNDEVIYVEVKGTRTLGTEVVLTPNEVDHALRRHPDTALFVLHSIKLKNGKAHGGTPRPLMGWKISKADLKARAYIYRVPRT